MRDDIKLKDPYHVTNPPTERKQVVRARQGEKPAVKSQLQECIHGGTCGIGGYCHDCKLDKVVII